MERQPESKRDWKDSKFDRDRMMPDKDRPMKECGKHEKRPNENDMLRICETCGRHYYVCDLCRKVKDIEAPLSVCMKCSTAYHTMKNILVKKDVEISELSSKLKRYEQGNKKTDDLKRQLAALKKSHDELKHDLKMRQEEIAELKKANQDLENKHDEMYSSLKAKEELMRDLKNLMDSSDYYDCTLTLNGSEHKYNAHKCILVARSETLKKLIHQQKPAVTSENKKQKAATASGSNHNVNLDLTDVEDAKMMQFLMSHLYTGSTDGIGDENLQSVMKLADKYELTGLRGACLMFMENRLNRATVIPILIEAYELNNERLKKKCMWFMQTNRIDLLSSPQWNQFKSENPKLALSLYERYIKETHAATATTTASTGSIAAVSSGSTTGVGGGAHAQYQSHHSHSITHHTTNNSIPTTSRVNLNNTTNNIPTHRALSPPPSPLNHISHHHYNSNSHTYNSTTNSYTYGFDLFD